MIATAAWHFPYLSREQWEYETEAYNLLIGTIMTPAPIVTEPDAFVSEAARLMLTYHINCLPVMRGETLVGILTSSDILTAFVKARSYA